MPVLDFEDAVRIVAPDGATVAARLTGAVETADPLSANLGHGETSLALQRWLQVQVTTSEPLDFDTGLLVFVDSSRRAARFTPRGPEGNQFVYLVKLANS